MHLYAFGSVCRGDITPGSDIDVLAITAGFDSRFDPALYSIYSYERLKEIWAEGNPFAWHLSLESKLLYSDDDSDYLQQLGSPARYIHSARDCSKFAALFKTAQIAYSSGTNSRIFELSTMFLAIRNFATCFSLGQGVRPDFSRHAALRLGTHSLSICREAYETLERARILCTRGMGEGVSPHSQSSVMPELAHVAVWMNHLMGEILSNERVQ